MLENEIMDSLGQRSALYRFFSRLYFAPLTQDDIESLSRVDFASLATGSDGAFAQGCDEMRRGLRRMNTGTRDELAADFTGAFYGAVTHEERTAQPFESLFGESEGFLMGQARGEVYHEFRRSGVKVREGLDLPEDHLSFIFEFMAMLCDQTHERVWAGTFMESEALLERQRAFSERHVLSWIDDFCDLADEIVRTRFYRGCLEATRGFAHDDAELIEAQLVCLQAREMPTSR